MTYYCYRRIRVLVFFLLKPTNSIVKYLHHPIFIFPEFQIMEHDCTCVTSSRKNVPWEVASNFKHYNLVKVTIVGFYSTEETILTFIRRLVEAAVNLEEICIRENTPPFCKYCNCPDPEAGSRFPRKDEERDAFRKRIINDGTSTATVKIHIHS